MEVESEAWVMVGWSTWEREVLHQFSRVAWVVGSRVRILETLERRRLEE